MKLIDTPEEKEKPIKVQIAESEIKRLNDEFVRRVNFHIAGFSRFWDNTAVTPDEFIEGLQVAVPGSDVGFIISASESYRHLATMAASLGKDINDFIKPEFHEPRRAFSVTNGSVKIAPPADGYDIHGKAIPKPPSLMDLYKKP